MSAVKEIRFLIIYCKISRSVEILNFTQATYTYFLFKLYSKILAFIDMYAGLLKLKFALLPDN